MIRYRSSTGFTLIELLISLVIVALLAAVAIPRFRNMSSKAKISAAEQEVDQAVQGLWYYRTENDSTSFPPSSMITNYEELRATISEYIGWPPQQSNASFTFVSYAGADTGFTLSARARDSDRTLIVATHIGLTTH